MDNPIVTDGSTEFKAAELNKFVAGNGSKLGIMLQYARIAYTGAAWEVVAGTDSCDIASGDLTWNATPDELEITLAGYSNVPVVIATPVATGNTIHPILKAHAASKTQAVVRFYDEANTQITVEDTDMAFNLMVIGT